MDNNQEKERERATQHLGESAATKCALVHLFVCTYTSVLLCAVGVVNIDEMSLMRQ